MTASIVLAAMAAAAWSAPVLARTPIDETRTAEPDGVVSVENLIGTVTVTGWSKNEVSVTGYLGEGPEGLTIDRDGDEISIVVEWPDEHDRHTTHKDSDSRLEVSVPAGSEVRVEGVNTEVTVAKVNGALQLSTVNGSITVTGSPENVEAETVNGSIDIDAETGEVDAETVNGRITIKGSHKEVSAQTVNGDISVNGSGLDSADFGTVSGSIEFTGSLAKRGSFDFETHSGSVILHLPKDTSAEFDVETFSGKIFNDFGPQAEKTSKYAPGYELSFTVGSGSAQVSASSFSGRVEIRTP
jgi:hypothetical protein